MNELKVLQDNPCLANKEKCGQLCCKMFTFTFKEKPKGNIKNLQIRTNPEQVHYLTLHEGVVARRGRINSLVEFGPEVRQKVVPRGKDWVVLFFAKCKALTPEGNCSLFGQKGRPQVCVEGYTVRKKNVEFVPHCIYVPDVDSKVLTEEDLA